MGEWRPHTLLFIAHWDTSRAPHNAHQPRSKAPSPGSSLRLHQCICVHRGGGICAVGCIGGGFGEEGGFCTREGCGTKDCFSLAFSFSLFLRVCGCADMMMYHVIYTYNTPACHT